ncbi:hypothetical protein DASC09_049610 [Saccharomycopsis crataegensis]|uniref:Uncharacterized protein n=1 Tax=Saccharomycopsis crataegensis TaxID=43959 RepID=A0AAV5QSU9_9ASCO|nr:hypothetical protein DASC09_049610 [Saccharomycopsis crataegensis]
MRPGTKPKRGFEIIIPEGLAVHHALRGPEKCGIIAQKDYFPGQTITTIKPSIQVLNSFKSSYTHEYLGNSCANCSKIIPKVVFSSQSQKKGILGGDLERRSTSVGPCAKCHVVQY